MNQSLGTLARTHTCGALTAADVGRDVVLLGWVHRIRDLGSLVFIDVRDRHGVTQVVARGNDALVQTAERVRPEYVIAVLGVVEARSPETVNPKVKTGDVEVAAREIRLLNDAKTPPFSIADDSPVSEDTRLKYRYLDLRRSRMQNNLTLRHRVTMEVRKYFDEQGFLEIETPMLAKSTPEGARDYLVPSRVHPGEFYALPQSPQIFKQILMIAGMDRYFQIVKCFRDEDLRADRQPEFTQVDLEISFATEDLVFSTIEPLMARLMALIGREISLPFLRLPYADAIARYGSDKPDLRCGMEIGDLSAPFKDSGFGVFRGAIESGGEVRGFVVPGAARLLAARNRRDRRDGEAVRRRWPGVGARGRRRGAELRAEGRRRGRDTRGAGARESRPGRSPADGGREARADVEDPRSAPPADRAQGEPAGSVRVRVPVGRRLPDVRVGRGGESLRVHAPSVHVAARERRGAARDGSRARARAGLRPRPERQRDRRAAAFESTIRSCSG